MINDHENDCYDELLISTIFHHRRLSELSSKNLSEEKIKEIKMDLSQIIENGMKNAGKNPQILWRNFKPRN